VQGLDRTMCTVETLHKTNNAVDRPFCNAISILFQAILNNANKNTLS